MWGNDKFPLWIIIFLTIHQTWMFNFEKKKLFLKNKINFWNCPTIQKGDYFISQSVTLLTPKLKKMCSTFFKYFQWDFEKKGTQPNLHTFWYFSRCTSICRTTQNISPPLIFFNVFFSSNHSAHQTNNKVIDMSTVVSVACLRQFTLFTNTQLVGWCK